jgi:two-component system cell cycle sensor histidine kinase/response regulator CckA
LFDPGRAQGVHLQMECLTEMTCVKVDPTQIQQVVVNLLINASDAMNGRGSIWVTLDSVDLPGQGSDVASAEVSALPPGSYRRLMIRDEGVGIAPENIDRVFDPFFTTKTIGKGSGLGLSVTQGIVASHGGAMAVSSVLGSGSCFSMYLPVCNEVLELAASVDREPHAPGSRRLLFVDDDPLVRNAWKRLLERGGWAVTCASDGEQGWTLFQEDPKRWDMVLTDLSMPKVTGIELARRIRGIGGKAQVVLMSGNVGVTPHSSGELAIFSAVVHKPADPEDLLNLLEQLATDQARQEPEGEDRSAIPENASSS